MSTEVTIVQNNIVNLSQWSDLQSRAEYLAKSELVPQALRGKPANVAIILQIGCELGISPMQAINGVTVVQGKPGVDPQLAIALIRRDAPGSVIRVETCEEKGKEMAKVFMARSRETEDEGYTATWTMQKAQQMGLSDKDNYKRQPLTMLRWRATMEAARMIFPDVIRGMYSPDELAGMPPDDSDPSSDKAALLNAKLSAAKEVVTEIVHVQEPVSAQVKVGPIPAVPAEAPTAGGPKLGAVPSITKLQLAVMIKEVGAKLGMDMTAISARCMQDFDKPAPEMTREEMWYLAQELEAELNKKETA